MSLATEQSINIMPVPLLDLKAQYSAIKEEVREALDCVIESQHFILGPEVEALEREIADYSGCKGGVGVSSGTDALLVALMALGIGRDDEVVTTSFSFFATAGSISRLGARPVFADIDPVSFNIDPASLERSITPQTKAVIPVHLYGQMSDMDAVMEIARRHNLHVIEDAAQAIGSEFNGRRAGSIGHLGCFSFFPSKNLGGFGDGGMVVSNDSDLLDRLSLLRNHGYRPKYYNRVVGGNFRLDALQAAVLRVKLRHLDAWTEARQRNADRYRRLFSEAGLVAEPGHAQVSDDHITLPQDLAYGRHIYNQFVIRSPHRDALMRHLKDLGIGTEIYYPVPLHLQECFADLGYRPGDLPRSEQAADETLALPIYPELTPEMQESVVEATRRFYQERR